MTEHDSILIVDDEPDARETLKDILEDDGYRVDLAERGAEAIQHVLQATYSAVLLDIRLPDLDGLAVLKVLLELDQKLPVILLTGHATIETTIRALNEGAFAYVTKPCKVEEIKATLRRAVTMKMLALKAELAEAELRASEERFRSVVESAKDAIVLMNAKGVILSWNQAAERLFGYPLEDIKGTSMSGLLAPGCRVRYHDAFEGLALLEAADSSGNMLELQGVNRAGLTFPVELSLAGWTSTGGPLFGAIIRDITERKRAEEALRRSYDETERILESLPCAILIADADLAVLYANAQAIEYFGGEGGSLTGCRLEQLLPLPSRATSETTSLIKGAEHHPCDGEFELDRSVYRYRLFPVALRGSERGQLGLVICDVTEQQRLQDQLIQAEKLASIGTLVFGMAHEINNPVQGILGIAEVLLDESDPDKIKEYAQDIVGYSQHVATVIRDFANYARPSSREGEAELDLRERLGEAVKLIKRSPHFGKIEVVTQFEAIAPIWARRTEIDQVFVNLMSNAIQAMGGQGILTLGTRLVEDRIVAVVSDTGPGIPKAFQHKVFDPFFTTKDPGKGTGLGLSIVYKIVGKYGGRIHFESEEGRGTTFVVEFPSRRAARVRTEDDTRQAEASEVTV